MEAAIITTYRCNCKYRMCNIWKYPTSIEEEVSPEVMDKLPQLDFCNITGGEPFLRADIEEIITITRKKQRGLLLAQTVTPPKKLLIWLEIIKTLVSE